MATQARRLEIREEAEGETKLMILRCIMWCVGTSVSKENVETLKSGLDAGKASKVTGICHNLESRAAD